MRRLFRCLVGKNGEGKGGLRRDGAKGGASHLQPVLGGSMSLLHEGINPGSLGALNLQADPNGFKFGTGHYLVACSTR